MKIIIQAINRYRDGVETPSFVGKNARLYSPEKTKKFGPLGAVLREKSVAHFSIKKLPEGVSDLSKTPLIFSIQTSANGSRSTRNVQLKKTKTGYEGKATFSIRKASPKPAPVPNPSPVHKESTSKTPNDTRYISVSGEIKFSESDKHVDPRTLRVAIVHRDHNISKILGNLDVDAQGKFSGELDHHVSDRLNLQAEIQKLGSKASFGKSELVIGVREHVDFEISYTDKTPKPSLYDRLNAVYADVKSLPVDKDELNLVLAASPESEAAIRRYFNAKILSTKISDEADGEVWNFYQDYQNALKQGTKERALADALVPMGTNAASKDRFAEIIFGLLRAMPTLSDSITLLSASRKMLEAQIKSATKAKDIGKFTAAETKDIFDGLIAIRDGLHLTYADKAHSMGPVILMGDPSLSKVSSLFDYFLDGKPLIDEEGKNKAILKLITAKEHARLIAAKDLISAVEDYPLMAGWFMAKQLSDRPRKPLLPGRGRALDPATLRQAASRYTAKQWASLAKSSGVPAHHKDEDNPEQSYAAHIVTGLLGDMPREVIIGQLEKSAAKRFKPLANVLRRNPDFDFREQAVDSYFSGKKTLNKTTRESLKTFARLDRIVPTSPKSVEHINKIAEAGYSSARDILNIGKIGYTESLMDKIPARVISQTYCGARVITDMLGEVHVQMAHSGLASATGLAHAVGGGASTATNVGDVEPPTLAQMFGSLDSCACTSCQSVHSPAAYLHNLLHWMKSDVKNAYPRLIEKRPDIPKILLNCANTHTVLPYIDLVNEALSWTIDGTAAPIDTTWDEDVLRLQPEYRYSGAEAQITQKNFPLALPYHRSSAEGRAALLSAGETTAEVMATFLNSDRFAWSDGSTSPQDNEWAAYRAARLNIDPAIYDMLIDRKPGTDFWEEFTGVDKTPGRSVGKIMTALDLGFEEMDALVRLDFIAKDDSGEEGFWVDEIEFSDSICSYEAASYKSVKTGNVVHNSGFDARTCSRALRLLRLSNITGKSTAELSNLIWRFSLANGSAFEINPEFLGFLSAADELEALCGVSLNDTLSYLELPYPNGTPDRHSAFAQLCTTRTGAEIELAESILGLSGIDLTDAEQMVAFLRRAIPLFANVRDLSAIRAMPMHDEGMSRADKLAAAPASLFSAIKVALTPPALAPEDLTALEMLIFEKVSSQYGVPIALCQAVYSERNDAWISDFDEALPTNLSDVPQLTDYANALWRESHHIWMHDMLTACSVSQDLIDIAIGEFEPDYPNTVPDYTKLPHNFAENLWSLRYLAVQYRATELELSELLIRSASVPAWLSPADAEINTYFQGNLSSISKADFIEKSLRLEQHSRILDVSESRLAVSFADPQNIGWDAPSTDGFSHNFAAEIFRLSYKNTDSRRQKQFEAASDEIRKNLRDALLALLISQNEKLDDEEDVYRLLLLDPAMQPCMMTSRLKLATGAVQLLMHRAMMNLEGGNIQADEDDQQQWEWRKNYRVWEANTKILLYPENWIDPSLRLNPTPLFENSVAMLAQDEVTEESSEAIIYDYLADLDKIARLDIRAFYRDEDNDVLHVFGRTWVAPYEHYYRRREDGVWTHWEKIDIDIEADHIIPVIFHRRLWLFWPIFIEKQTEEKKEYKEIKLAYTTYEFGKWRGKKLLGKSVIAGPIAGREAGLNFKKKFDYGNADMAVGLKPKDFLFIARVKPSNNQLSIMVRRSYDKEYNDYTGYSEIAFDDGWAIDSCNAEGDLVPAGYNTPAAWMDHVVARPFMTLPNAQNMSRGYNGYEDRGGAELYVKLKAGHIGHSTPILSKAPEHYTLTYPQQRHALWDNPFFMMDSQHTHFYERKTKCVEVDYGLISSLDLVVHLPKPDNVYEVSLHEHPYSCQMIATFNQYGVDGIYGRGKDQDGLKRQSLYDNKYYGYGNASNYKPSPYQRISHPYPKLEFDFDTGSAYGTYNWELFFHLPTLIARQLKSDGRHSDAIRWLSMVFDPTSRENLGPRRVWRIKPFMTADSRSNIAALVQLLGQNPSNSEDIKLRKSFESQLKAWRETPFEPHRIAEHRLSAYMMWAALEYVDVLIEWGDALFKQDSMESINEATNLYLLADAILGKRPTVVEKGTVNGAQSFEDLNSLSLNAAIPDWVSDLEGWMMAPSPDNGCKPQACHASVFAALSPKNYFCIPPNPKLPEYWDRVADRLFKIRHCRNLAGDQRSLALFQPPIDPALLVRARASGLSVSDVIAGLTETGLGYRFQFLLQKAQDFTAEVKSFGGQLLSALEKRDGEELSLIRQTHEMNIQKATRNLKKMSLAEAKESLAALQHSRASTQLSYEFFNSRDYMNSREITAKDRSDKSDDKMKVEQYAQGAASVLRALPDVYTGFAWSVQYGGQALGAVASIAAVKYGIDGSILRSESGRASTLGSYDRRWDDWDNQKNQTSERLKELDRQIAAAEIRLQTAEKDLEIFDKQTEQTREIYDYVNSKFTGEKLYSWMANTLKTAHRQAFEIASNMARQAQMAANREIRDASLNFITADQWDSSRAGLLAGERLSLQLKQLDNAYWKEKDRVNIYEMTRTVSLRRLDPTALYALKMGVDSPVAFKLPEWLFQSEHNGKGLKDMRIQSVALSLPCTTGPNAKVDLKLRLTNGGNKASKSDIITSTAQSDAGRFDPNPNGNSYLPFENENVDSEWEITLPKRREFNPITINDVVLTVRYTGIADDEVETDEPLQASEAQGFALSLKHDFYTAWLEGANQSSTFSADFIFPEVTSSEFLDRVPYIYEGNAHNYDADDDGVHVLTRVDGKTNIHTVSLMDNVFTTNGSTIEFSGEEVVDIIAIAKVT